MYFAASGSARVSSAWKIAPFLAGPEAASMAVYASATSRMEGPPSGSPTWPAFVRTSKTAIPRSDERS